jgi:predicted RNA-binding protein
MCLATAYLHKGSEEPILRDIAHVRFHSDRVEMETLFGQEKVIPGRVLEIDFSTSKIILDQYRTSTVVGDSDKDDKAWMK